MTYRMMTMRRCMGLGVVLGLSAASPAWAQVSGSPLGGGGPIGPIQDLNEGKPGTNGAGARAPVAALPGARSDPSRVAPPTKLPSEMNPTDALFDAINRGDIASARDAIDRGADLGAQNVLGMSPLDLSVDLGRNDISFLLLSQRGADTNARPPSAQQASKAGAKAKPAREVRSRVTATAKVAQPAAPRTAQLFGGDGGAPVPSAGFLGFGGGTGRN